MALQEVPNDWNWTHQSCFILLLRLAWYLNVYVYHQIDQSSLTLTLQDSSYTVIYNVKKQPPWILQRNCANVIIGSTYSL